MQGLISVILLPLWPPRSQFFPISTQNLLTLAPLRWITLCWGWGTVVCSIHCGCTAALLFFYPLDASSIPLRIYDNQNISRHCQTFPRGAKLPLVESHSSRRQILRNINTIILTTVAGAAPFERSTLHVKSLMILSYLIFATKNQSVLTLYGNTYIAHKETRAQRC